MKKLAALILALCLMLSMCVSASAVLPPELVITATPETRVSDLMERNPIVARVDDDQEVVAERIRRDDFIAADPRRRGPPGRHRHRRRCNGRGPGRGQCGGRAE